jgi:hypothetical protein
MQEKSIINKSPDVWTLWRVTMKYTNAIVPKELLKNVVENIEYNKVIIDYYTRFSQEDGKITFNKDTLERNSMRLDNCNRFWQLDKYEEQKLKDFLKTNLCHDKFCANCKKVKQASRMAKYIPELEQYKDRLYHLTLTLPNCPGDELLFTYKKMAKCFKSLIRYLTGNLNIKGLDFSSWGYEGAVRSLEVTFNGNSYHPHFHVGIVLGNQLLGRKTIINKYSWDYKTGLAELKRLFSEQEQLIQKLWYLLLNGIKVTKKNIDELDEGYSCTMDKFPEEDFAELFKYISKETDENGNVLTYENFISLYYGLYRVKQIQGYGCLYRITDEGDLEGLEEQYEEYIQEIRKKESPKMVYEKPQDLLLDTEYTLISRKNYFKYLRQLDNSIKEDKNKE